ncbi:hypothetical protein M427DRAFT_29787 [Gonapodya prolifera JEL478]|uniref:Uncharacterized protein n=1 Tax=Gonapodya prolifera (strain JEL478) TaxID=1344416 RepID=A0A139AP06_GONPJ|nr:hypothetical protein M427DRAFT_29787 [Gonapodya prolifera JEL478]|eukprot:KXS18491.1 hypothetical protein M427DRAFT_29787 [Gonapodya prolifera JEL478]
MSRAALCSCLRGAALYGPNKDVCYWCDQMRRKDGTKSATKGTKKKTKAAAKIEFTDEQIDAAACLTVTDTKTEFATVTVLRNRGLPLSLGRHTTAESKPDVRTTAIAGNYGVRPVIGRAVCRALVELYMLRPSLKFIMNMITCLGFESGVLQRGSRLSALSSVEQIVNHSGINSRWQADIVRELGSVKNVLGPHGAHLLTRAVRRVIPETMIPMRESTTALLLGSRTRYRDEYRRSLEVPPELGLPSLASNGIDNRAPKRQQQEAGTECVMERANAVVDALRHCMRKGQHKYDGPLTVEKTSRLSEVPFEDEAKFIFKKHAEMNGRGGGGGKGRGKGETKAKKLHKTERGQQF